MSFVSIGETSPVAEEEANLRHLTWDHPDKNMVAVSTPNAINRKNYFTAENPLKQNPVIQSSSQLHLNYPKKDSIGAFMTKNMSQGLLKGGTKLL